MATVRTSVKQSVLLGLPRSHIDELTLIPFPFALYMATVRTHIRETVSGAAGGEAWLVCPRSHMDQLTLVPFPFAPLPSFPLSVRHIQYATAVYNYVVSTTHFGMLHNMPPPCTRVLLYSSFTSTHVDIAASGG